MTHGAIGVPSRQQRFDSVAMKPKMVHQLLVMNLP